MVRNVRLNGRQQQEEAGAAIKLSIRKARREMRNEVGW